MSKQLEDWNIFRGIIKNTKLVFFNDKIQEIASKN